MSKQIKRENRQKVGVSANCLRGRHGCCSNEKCTCKCGHGISNIGEQQSGASGK